MKVLIHADAASAAGRVAEEVIALLAERPDAVLGLATGGTMEPVYARLVEAHREGRVSFGAASSFNLDEYLGVAPDHPGSFHRFMRERLLDLVDFAPDRTALPAGGSADPLAEANAYEAAIRAAGGIDLQLLGIGRNGHVGFNEPTSSLGSRTRVKTLTRTTREANSAAFGSLEATPRHAITMGVATILEARRLLLLAVGEAKAEAVRGMVEGPVSAACPASALQLHPAATVVLDPAAASALRLRDYYEEVHPRGDEPRP